MKTPQKALLLLGRNKSYPIVVIHFDTEQVTLKESDKVYNILLARQDKRVLNRQDIIDIGICFDEWEVSIP